MKNVLTLISIILIFSCKQKEKENFKEYRIHSRTYNLQNKGIDKNEIKMKIVTKDNSKFFIYNLNKIDGSIDSLKLNNNNIFLNNVLLKKIDTKRLDLNGSFIVVDKYFYQPKNNHGSSCYYFLNKNNGLFFMENLNSGLFIEFDIKKYNSIHKAIVNGTIITNQLNFKKGPNELKLPNYYKYPELNTLDSIKEGNRWRYFYKK
ncbi:hypothetical protein [Flavobacterium aestivum]|uniref:hypothetical protein n=1 Tax=Flavobacterium aestivum TaxID=3003257 RepID=UPI002482E770|nr:hypothetical protein [Flavobacterium aestivum]